MITQIRIQAKIPIDRACFLQFFKFKYFLTVWILDLNEVHSLSKTLISPLGRSSKCRFLLATSTTLFQDTFWLKMTIFCKNKYQTFPWSITTVLSLNFTSHVRSIKTDDCRRTRIIKVTICYFQWLNTKFTNRLSKCVRLGNTKLVYLCSKHRIWSCNC